MKNIGDQLNHYVHSGVQRLKRLPAQVLEHIPNDCVQLGSQGHDHDVLRLRAAHLQRVNRPDGMETRPATAREFQVQRDREFFHNHRAALQGGQNWAGRGWNGQLHLRPHSSQAADMMMAIDRTTRIEAAPLHYLAGEIQGGGETLKDTARLAQSVAQPFTTLQSQIESDAGKALDHFRQDSAQITVDAVHQAGNDFLEAQNEPNRGGRATGKVGANILLAAMPLPLPKRLFRLRGLTADAPKGAPELGPYPNRIWRPHPNHTRPSKPPGGKPGGTMEPFEPKDLEKLRSQKRQLESAELMADRGFDISHRPQSEVKGVKNPDFEIEGAPFDNYAPKTSQPDRMRVAIQTKVKEQQTRRVVVNLDDSPITPAELQQVLLGRRIKGLEEVITIRQGEIEHIYP